MIKRPPEIIVSEARSRIGEQGYDLKNSNCQHFCTKCRYGIEKSIEIDKVKKVADIIVKSSSAVIGRVYTTVQKIRQTRNGSDSDKDSD